MRQRSDWAQATNMFFVALGAGFVLICLLKLILPGIWGGFFVAVLLGLILFGVIVIYKRDPVIDPLRAGDNVYYLGLLTRKSTNWSAVLE